MVCSFGTYGSSRAHPIEAPWSGLHERGNTLSGSALRAWTQPHTVPPPPEDATGVPRLKDARS